MARLRALGPTARRPTAHRSLTQLEVSLGDEPGAPVLDVWVEERSRGSYVTVRVLPRRFLRDFMHIVRCGLSVCALVGVIHVLDRLESKALYQSLSGIGLGWACLLSLTLMLEQLLHRSVSAVPHAARLRHQIASLMLD